MSNVHPIRPPADRTSPQVKPDQTAADLEYWSKFETPDDETAPPRQGTLAGERARHWVERAKQNAARATPRPHPGPIYPTKGTPTND